MVPIAARRRAKPNKLTQGDKQECSTFHGSGGNSSKRALTVSDSDCEKSLSYLKLFCSSKRSCLWFVLRDRGTALVLA